MCVSGLRYGEWKAATNKRSYENFTHSEWLHPLSTMCNAHGIAIKDVRSLLVC
nr:MAG TPA: hypothetical protein [Caudoviricetes sp.]